MRIFRAGRALASGRAAGRPAGLVRANKAQVYGNSPLLLSRWKRPVEVAKLPTTPARAAIVSILIIALPDGKARGQLKKGGKRRQKGFLSGKRKRD